MPLRGGLRRRVGLFTVGGKKQIKDTSGPKQIHSPPILMENGNPPFPPFVLGGDFGEIAARLREITRDYMGDSGRFPRDFEIPGEISGDLFFETFHRRILLTGFVQSVIKCLVSMTRFG